MRTPNLNALRMFDAAARHLNFRRAAEELHLTQGAVAQQVRHLEADLGQPLFTRLPRGLALTPNGAAYHRAIRRAIQIIEAATAELAPAVRRVALSVTPSLATKWLIPRLAALREQHPDIDLAITASETLANFTTDGIDLAIRLGQPPFPSSFHATLLAPQNLCAVTSPDLAAHLPAQPQLADLLRHPLIEDSHNHWQSFFDGQTKPRILQLNQTALALDAAASGQGIALAPYLLAAADIAAERLTMLWQNPIPDPRGFYLLRPGSADLNPSQRIVANWIITAAQTPLEPDPSPSMPHGRAA